MKRIVLDTNVIVSAVLSPFGAPARILDAVLNGHFTLLYDDRIITEYRDVLNRKKFGFDAETVADLLNYIETVGEHVIPSPLNIQLRDKFDLSFIEVAVSGSADALITGNIKHFQKMPNIQLLTPAEFLQRCRA